MSTIPWKLEKDLCRCCHAEGNFHNLAEPGLHSGRTEVYLDMLKSSLDVDINPVEGMLYAMTFAICEGCIVRLRDATSFKQQVLSCEERFREMYAQYINAFKPEVKIEPKEPEEVKVEELDDQQAFDVNFTDSDDDDKPLLKKILMSQPVKKKASSGRARGRPRKLQSVPKKKTNKKPKKVEIEDTEDEPNHSGDEMEEEQTEPAGTVEPKKEKKKKDERPSTDMVGASDYRKEGVEYVCTRCEHRSRGLQKVKGHIRNIHLKMQSLKAHNLRLHCQQAKKSDDTKSHKDLQIQIETSKDGLNVSDAKTKDSDSETNDFVDLSNLRDNSIIDLINDSIVGPENEKYKEIKKKKETVKDRCKSIVYPIKKLKYQCLKCKNIYLSVSGVKEHYKTHLNSAETSDDKRDEENKNKDGERIIFVLTSKDFFKDGDEFVCRRCDKRFTIRRRLRYHVMSDHLKIYDYPCQYCEEGFYSKEHYVVHKFKVHGVDDRFKCKACEAAFCSSYKLQKHHSSFHKLGKKYTCESCDYETFRFGYLTRHNVKHNPIKIFKCRFCEKSFSRKTVLDLHEKIHTGDKRKVCKVCSKAFVQKASLNYHMTKYHPEVNF